MHASNFSSIVIACPSTRCSGTISTGVIPGSVTLIQLTMDFKKPLNIEFAFIFLFVRGISLPNTARFNQIRAATPDVVFFLTNVRATFLCRRETTWKALGWHSVGPRVCSTPGQQAKELRRALRHMLLSYLTRSESQTFCTVSDYL